MFEKAIVTPKTVEEIANIVMQNMSKRITTPHCRILKKRTLLMTKEVRKMAKLTQEEQETRESVLKELKRYRQELNTGERSFLNGPEPVRRLISDWKELRPKMVRKYQKMGILKEFALVCLERRDDERMKLLKAGYPPPDANEEASQNLFLWSEEDDETEETEGKDNGWEVLALLMDGPMTAEKKEEYERLTGKPFD